MDEASGHGRRRRLREAPGGIAASAASCAASASSNTIERAAAPSTEGAEIRFDRGGTITLFSGSNNQGQGHETAFKQIVCDRLGVDPKDVTYISGDTDTVFYGEGTGGSRSATLGGSAVAGCRRQGDREGARRSPRTCSRSASSDIKFEDGMFSSPKHQPDDRPSATSRAACRQSGQAAEGHGGRPDRHVGLLRRRARTSRTAAMSARSRSTRRPAQVEIVRYSVRRRRRHRDQPAAGRTARSPAASRRASARS